MEHFSAGGVKLREATEGTEAVVLLGLLALMLMARRRAIDILCASTKILPRLVQSLTVRLSLSMVDPSGWTHSGCKTRLGRNMMMLVLGWRHASVGSRTEWVSAFVSC